MKRLLIVALLASACRPADGTPGTAGAQGTPDSARSAASIDSAGADSMLARADQGRIQGDPGAPVWVVELSDFQCPACKQWHDETYATFKREFIDTKQVRFAYLNYPLSQHQNAIPAAEAAMCSSLQGKFWPMFDALFATQDNWAFLPNPRSMFDSLAARNGMNMSEWRSCFASGVMVRLVEADRGRARDVGARQTPSFVIGNTLVPGALPISAMRQAIAQAKRAGSSAAPPQ